MPDLSEDELTRWADNFYELLRELKDPQLNIGQDRFGTSELALMREGGYGGVTMRIEDRMTICAACRRALVTHLYTPEGPFPHADNCFVVRCRERFKRLLLNPMPPRSWYKPEHWTPTHWALWYKRHGVDVKAHPEILERRMLPEKAIP